MSKDAMIRARIESDLKAEVEQIFQELGLTTTEAITLFYNQVRLFHGLPFRVRIPNEETVQTFKETDAGLNLVEHDSIEDMFEHLDI